MLDIVGKHKISTFSSVPVAGLVGLDSPMLQLVRDHLVSRLIVCSECWIMVHYWAVNVQFWTPSCSQACCDALGADRPVCVDTTGADLVVHGLRLGCDRRDERMNNNVANRR